MFADISVLSAFVGGLLIFLSPCVLPIVPFYLSYMAGVSMGELSDDQTDLPPGVRRRALAAAVMFSLGIITVFTLLGAGAFWASQVFRTYIGEFRLAAAALIFVMALHFLGVIRLPFMERSFQVGGGKVQKMSVWGAYLVGLAFAAGWTACVGGVLAGVMFLAAQEQTAWQGLGLMLVLGVGMTLPFVVAAAFVGPFLRFAARFKRYLPMVEKAMGVLLIVFAILIATNSINQIANWLVETFPIFRRLEWEP